MSTGLECQFVEYKPGEWFYILERDDAPKNSWDWREFATAYGPFTTQKIADEHLSDNHANPGGYSVVEFDPEAKTDDVLERLVAEARKSSPVRRGSIFQRRRW